MIVEACVDSLKSALLAQSGGVDRLELNAGLYLGGLTPSLGLVRQVTLRVDLPTIVMVRPRPGGFVYSDLEFETMAKDAEILLQEDISGLAFGCLEEDGYLNNQQTKYLVDLCQEAGKEAVFHRAFDMATDPYSLCQQLINLKVNRVLTSGQADKVTGGLSLIEDLIAHYGNQLDFCLGSGVTADNVLEIIQATGGRQVHASFKEWEQDPTTRRPDLDFAYNSEGDFESLSLDKVRALIQRIGR